MEGTAVVTRDGLVAVAEVDDRERGSLPEELSASGGLIPADRLCLEVGAPAGRLTPSETTDLGRMDVEAAESVGETTDEREGFVLAAVVAGLVPVVDFELTEPGVGLAFAEEADNVGFDMGCAVGFAVVTDNLRLGAAAGAAGTRAVVVTDALAGTAAEELVDLVRADATEGLADFVVAAVDFAGGILLTAPVPKVPELMIFNSTNSLYFHNEEVY